MDEATLVTEIRSRFRTFGGETNPNSSNPIAHAMADQAIVFALGVDVGEVVRFVAERLGCELA